MYLFTIPSIHFLIDVSFPFPFLLGQGVHLLSLALPVRASFTRSSVRLSRAEVRVLNGDEFDGKGGPQEFLQVVRDVK